MSADLGRTIKMVLVGDVKVGKTSLANVFVDNHFQDHYSTSIAALCMTKTLDNPRVTLRIWDTAGMEQFRSLLPGYMRDAECAVIVYDRSSSDTFCSVRDFWIDYVKANSSEALIKVLAANKSDTQTKGVTDNEGRRLAESHNMLYFETSAKYNTNVYSMFTEASMAVIRTTPTPVRRSDSVIRLDESRQKRGKCCLSSPR